MARGIHAALPSAKPVSHTSSLQDATATESVEPLELSSSASFRYTMSHKQEVVEEGLVCIQNYIERSTSFIIQKAFAFQLFATSVVNGIEVLKACVLAAKCSTFSS